MHLLRRTLYPVRTQRGACGVETVSTNILRCFRSFEKSFSRLLLRFVVCTFCCFVTRFCCWHPRYVLEGMYTLSDDNLNNSNTKNFIQQTRHQYDSPELTHSLTHWLTHFLTDSLAWLEPFPAASPSPLSRFLADQSVSSVVAVAVFVVGAVAKWPSGPTALQRGTPRAFGPSCGGAALQPAEREGVREKSFHTSCRTVDAHSSWFSSFNRTDLSPISYDLSTVSCSSCCRVEGVPSAWSTIVVVAQVFWGEPVLCRSCTIFHDVRWGTIWSVDDLPVDHDLCEALLVKRLREIRYFFKERTLRYVHNVYSMCWRGSRGTWRTVGSQRHPSVHAAAFYQLPRSSAFSLLYMQNAAPCSVEAHVQPYSNL